MLFRDETMRKEKNHCLIERKEVWWVAIVCPEDEYWEGEKPLSDLNQKLRLISYPMPSVWICLHPRGNIKEVLGGIEEGHVLYEGPLINQVPSWSRKSGVELESCDPYFCAASWEFTLTLKDVARLTMLLMFEEANAIRIVPE